MRKFHNMSSKRKKSTSIYVFVLSGIIGFGIGGTIGGVTWVVFDAPHLGFAILGAIGGAIGGASIGIALKDWKSTVLLSLASNRFWYSSPVYIGQVAWADSADAMGCCYTSNLGCLWGHLFGINSGLPQQ